MPGQQNAKTRDGVKKREKERKGLYDVKMHRS